MKILSVCKAFFTWCCFLFLFFESSAQCPVADFTISSPVCAGSALDIINNSTGATSYEWDFAPGYLSGSPTKLSDTTLALSYSGDIITEVENDTLITFLCGKGDSKIYRIIYGNGPENPLTQIDDLGNLGTLYQPSDMDLYMENGSWYGMIVDYGNNSLVRFHLGNSLRNTPDSVVVLLNNGNSMFNAPWSIKIAKDESGMVHGLVANFLAGTISHLDFGNSILNNPTPSTPISVTGTTYVLDLQIAHQCGNWYAFIGGYNSSNIIRADFGNSLSNTPSFTTVLSSGSPSDLVLINDSSVWKIIYTNYNSNDISRFELGTDLSNIIPVFKGNDYFGGSAPKGITTTRMGAAMYVNVLFSVSYNLQMLKYSNSTVVNNYIDTSADPSNILFSGGGSFPVTLKAFDSSGNFSTKTVMINIVPGPTSGFSYSDLCLGNATMFTDTSSIPSGNILTWNWDFGDSSTSAFTNPSHTYSAEGTYNVQLVVASNSGCVDTFITSLNITPKPVASFTSPGAICSQTALQFTDQSSVVTGSVASWNWYFGNGDTSSAQNPLYSYPAGGSMQVSLVATTAAGCTDSTSSLITIDDRPSAAFLAENTCLNQNVIFIDKTTLSGSSISSYSWDFGDGNTDTSANPTHLYAPVVLPYNVELIVTALNGCSDTATNWIKINNVPTVNFTSSPAVVCQNNDVQFTDLSDVVADTISGWAWDFGDGGIDSVMNPVHRFAYPGQYPVSLIAYSPSSCPGVVFQQIVDVQESPVASFATSMTCIGSSTHFTNNSIPAPNSSIDSVLWHFSATDSSGIYSPDFQFATIGDHTVSLTVISSEGCSSTDSSNVIVHDIPVASFTNSNICSGVPITFTNTSVCDSNSVITQFDWNFGDFGSGSQNTSTAVNPSHTFLQIHSYNVSLIVTTDFGCADTVTNSVYVNQSPPAQFTYSPTCYGDLMEFFNPGSPLDSTYLWNFGDNQSNQLREPAHYYAFAGTYTVTLNVMSTSGCTASASKQVTVSPIPTADFIAAPACLNTNYMFEENSTILSGSITNWKWNISGLPSPDSIQNPTYVFADTGNYTTTLTITSDIGCTKSVTKTIGVHSLPEANFSSDPQFGNPPLDIQTIDYSVGGNTYIWNFGDGSDTVIMHEPTHTYVDTGMFGITQIVVSPFGCRDTIIRNIYVIKPVLDVAVTGDSSYFEGEYFHVVARLANLGTREISSLRMETELQNGSTISEMNLVPIPNGQAGYQTYTFNASFLTDAGNPFQYYCVRAVFPDGETDDFPANNEKCFNLTDQLAGLEVYPNPCVDDMTLKLIPPFSDELNVELFDQSGKRIAELYNGETPKNMKDIHYNMSHLKEGLYRLRIKFGDTEYSRPVVHVKKKR